MVFQLALLWFLQTQSCQLVGTVLHYLPIQTPSFYPAMEVFQAPLAAEELERRPSPRGWPAGHFFLTCAASVSRSFWRFPFFSFPFLYCWQLIFPSILPQESFERSSLLCSDSIYFQKAPGFHVRRLLGRQGTHAYIPVLLHSARLHGGNILLPILGSAWPGPQLHHSNMLKSKMHMPLK